MDDQLEVDWEALRDRADRDRTMMREEGYRSIRFRCARCDTRWVGLLLHPEQRVGDYLAKGAVCPLCRASECISLEPSLSEAETKP